MADLFEKDKTQSLTLDQQQWVIKRAEILAEQNRNLKKQALDNNASAGYINTLYTRGTFKTAFATPLEQSLISEEMAHEGYFALALKIFTSLCKGIKVELKYKTEELNTDPKHKLILDFVKKQIDNVGGFENLFEVVIAPSLRTGVGCAVPALKIVDNKYIGFKGISNINMQNLQRFYFDPNNPAELKSIDYLTYNKMVDKSLFELDKDGKVKTDSTPMEMIHIDLSNNCVAYHAHDADSGDPLGVPYLYFLYSYYKKYKAMNSSVYNALQAFGSYPMGVKRTTADTGKDSLQWETEATQRLSDILFDGGGVYVDGEGELYNLMPPDMESLALAEKNNFDIVMRTAGLGQVTTGITGGGSQDLMKSLDVFTDTFVSATVERACISINKTMIKSLVKMNWRKEYLTDKIVEYPILMINKNSDVIVNKVNDTETPNTKDTINQSKETIKQAMVTTEVKDYGNVKTFIVKNKPNDIESKIILDVKELDDMLVKNTDDLARILKNELAPKLKKAIEDTYNIKKGEYSMKTLPENIKVWGFLSNDKKQFENSLRIQIERIVRDSAMINAEYIENALVLANSNFEKEMKSNIVDYANKIADRYMKTDMSKGLINSLVSSGTQYVKDFVTQRYTALSITPKNTLSEAIRNVMNSVDDLKGLDFQKIAEQSTISTFSNVGTYENKDFSKKNSNYVLIWSGILEGMCGVCDDYVGDIFYYNESKDEFINKSGVTAEFPYSRCIGMKYGNKCRCFGIMVPQGQVGIKS